MAGTESDIKPVKIFMIIHSQSVIKGLFDPRSYWVLALDKLFMYGGMRFYNNCNSRRYYTSFLTLLIMNFSKFRRSVIKLF